MKEALVGGEELLVSNDQSAEPTEPSKGPFDLPPALVATEGATVLSGFLAASATIRTDRLDAPIVQAGAERVRIVGAIGNKFHAIGQRDFGMIQGALQRTLLRRGEGAIGEALAPIQGLLLR